MRPRWSVWSSCRAVVATWSNKHAWNGSRLFAAMCMAPVGRRDHAERSRFDNGWLFPLASEDSARSYQLQRTRAGSDLLRGRGERVRCWRRAGQRHRDSGKHTSTDVSKRSSGWIRGASGAANAALRNQPCSLTGHGNKGARDSAGRHSPCKRSGQRCSAGAAADSGRPDDGRPTCARAGRRCR
jgi:hypothetical protein